MPTPGVQVSGSPDAAESRYVFQHPVAGARVFVGHLMKPSEDPITAQLTTNSWAVFTGVGEPMVNPLMPTETYRTTGLWVCQDDALAEEILTMLNRGVELGFQPYTGDMSILKMQETNRNEQYAIPE